MAAQCNTLAVCVPRADNEALGNHNVSLGRPIFLLPLGQGWNIVLPNANFAQLSSSDIGIATLAVDVVGSAALPDAVFVLQLTLDGTNWSLAARSPPIASPRVLSFLCLAESLRGWRLIPARNALWG